MENKNFNWKWFLKPKITNIIILVILIVSPLSLMFLSQCSTGEVIVCNFEYYFSSFTIPIIYGPLVWFGSPASIYTWIIAAIYVYLLSCVIAAVLTKIYSKIKPEKSQ